MEIERQRPELILGCLQRTGSNLVQRGIEDNLDLSISNDRIYEWKHGSPPAIDSTLSRYILLCTRNPYAWLVSCYRYFINEVGKDTTICPQFKLEMTFKDFIRLPSYSYQNPMRRYSVFYELWIKRMEDQRHRGNGSIIKSETMMSQDGQATNFIRIGQGVFGQAWIPPRHCDIKTYVKVINNMADVTDQNFDHGSYEKHEYLNHFDEEDLIHIRDHLDPEVCAKMGYGILNPSNPLTEDLDSGF